MSDLHARIGGLPSDWNAARFGDVLVASRTAVTVNKAEQYREIGIRSHGKGVFHKEPVNGSELGNKRVFWVEPVRLVFNIIFAWERAVAVTSAAEAGMIASHRFPMYRPVQPGTIDVDFLRRFFLTDRGAQLLGEASPGGAGRNRTLNQKFLAETPVPLPPLQEQRKIAAILSAVDDVIEKTETVVESLQRLKRAMMQELLTRGLPRRHTRFKQTAIGEIPKEWELRSVGEVVQSCDYGLSAKMSADVRLTPILRMGNISDGEVLLEHLKYVDDALPTASGLHLAFGDVLFNRTNSKNLVGKVGVFVGADRPITFASYLLRMKPKPSVAWGPWLAAVLNTDVNQSALRALATPGVSQANINRTKLLAFVVPTPPFNEQKEILAALDVLSNRIRSETRVLASTRTIKSALMSALFTGKPRVTLDEDVA